MLRISLKQIVAEKCPISSYSHIYPCFCPNCDEIFIRKQRNIIVTSLYLFHELGHWIIWQFTGERKIQRRYDVIWHKLKKRVGM